jgi:uncharacterized protein (DUF488 family)
MNKPAPSRKHIIYTIGHSTHPIDAFLQMLNDFHIQKVVDVRTIPKSRFNPQYNEDSLRQSLAIGRIKYLPMPGLGGLRHARKDSVNMGWRNASFRGYADYMQTDDFAKNLQALIKESRKDLTAIMCAEAVPWRCHRSLIADALVVEGIEVRNIMSAHKDSEHHLNPMARLQDKKITYPPA